MTRHRCATRHPRSPQVQQPSIAHAGSPSSKSVHMQGSVLASDAFFPFAWNDSVELACKAGVKAIAHPGGSMRDQGVPLVHTLSIFSHLRLVYNNRNFILRHINAACCSP